LNGLRFLLDVNVGSSVRRFLLNLGHDVSSVVDIDPRMSDEQILRLALEEGSSVTSSSTGGFLTRE